MMTLYTAVGRYKMNGKALAPPLLLPNSAYVMPSKIAVFPAVSQMASGPVTSFSQDVVTSNSVGGVETAVVMVDEQTTYDNFKVTDITSKADFEKKANVIGTTWRTPAMPRS